jgi:hypothetical protein
MAVRGGGIVWTVVAAAAMLAPPSHRAVAQEVDVAAEEAARQQAAIGRQLSELIRQALIDHLPREFVDESDWGQVRPATIGYQVKGKWFEPRWEPRVKEVNHGLWKRYRAELVDPEQHLAAYVPVLQPDGPGRVFARIVVQVRVHGEARVERWRQGIKMLNFSTDGSATIEATINCTVSVRYEPGKGLGEIVVTPHVQQVWLRLVDFELRRISKLGRDIAREIGDSFRGTVQRQLARQEPRSAEKLNQAIAKKQDRLRFSASDLVGSGWLKHAASQ